MNQENEKVIGSPLKPRGSQSFVGKILRSAPRRTST